MKNYLILAKEVSDFNRLVVVANASIDWKVSIHKPHLITVALGDVDDKFSTWLRVV